MPVDLATVQPPPLDQFTKATKYHYDTTIQNPSCRWIGEETRVYWTSQPVGKGGMRDCFLVWELDSNSERPTQMIGKVFQADVRPVLEDYMNEAITQCVSDTFAQEYNRLGHQEKISFLACYVVKLKHTGSGNAVFTMEPMLRGVYEKHNNNVGQVFTQNQTAEAFSHFTFHSSDKKLLVCDLQGVGGMYTDPQIHSLSGEDFGLGNLGKEGIRKWIAGHRCGPLCTAMGFPSLNPSSNPPSREVHVRPPSVPPPRPGLAWNIAREMRSTFMAHNRGANPPGGYQPYQNQHHHRAVQYLPQQHRHDMYDRDREEQRARQQLEYQRKKEKERQQAQYYQQHQHPQQHQRRPDDYIDPALAEEGRKLEERRRKEQEEREAFDLAAAIERSKMIK